MPREDTLTFNPLEPNACDEVKGLLVHYINRHMQDLPDHAVYIEANSSIDEFHCTHTLIQRERNSQSRKQGLAFEVIDTRREPLAKGGFGEILETEGVLTINLNEFAFSFKAKPGMRIVKFQVLKHIENHDFITKEFNFCERAGYLGAKRPSFFHSTKGEVGVIVQRKLGENSLQALLDKGQLPLHQRLSICKHFLNELMGLHEKAICHADIKPLNIVLNKDYYPRIIDFGAARNFDDRKNPNDRVIGTPDYVPPEVSYRGSAFDYASFFDIFSAGIIVAQTLGCDVTNKARNFDGLRTLLSERSEQSEVKTIEKVLIHLVHAMMIRSHPENRLPLEQAKNILEQVESYLDQAMEETHAALKEADEPLIQRVSACEPETLAGESPEPSEVLLYETPESSTKCI